tara:strand:- start:183 stop:596 length:414 start_codon:yes stop_codon:yes gene_type:complete
MGLSFDEIADVIQKSIEKDEALGIHELQELADKSEGHNFMQVNALYAVKLEDHKNAQKPKPTLKQAKSYVWGLIRKQPLKEGSVVMLNPVETDIHLHDTYGQKLFQQSINSFIKDDNWLDYPEKNKLVITKEGAKHL